MKIGSKIKIFREIKGISTKEMAHRLDMSLAGYSKIERDDVDVNTERLTRIAEELGTKPEDIIAFDERYVQNNYGENSTNQLGVIHNQFPDKLISLYEDKIRLLEEKIAYLEKQLN